MASGRYVSYLRVSTGRQAASGLGLEAQRHSVERFLNGGSWRLVAEFVEVESGRNRSRPQLEEAIRACKTYRATLVVAKLDRLARDVGFLSKLRDESVEFTAVDMPAANSFCITVMVALAEQEAEMISERTRAALASAKRRGVKLGTPSNLSRGDRRKGAVEAARMRQERARARAEELRPAVRDIRAEGATSLRAIAARLNARGVPTPTERGTWTATQVSRVLGYLTDL